MLGRNAPFLHVFWDQAVVSMLVTSSELVKPAHITKTLPSTFHESERFIDSLTYNESRLWNSAMIKDNKEAGLIQNVRTLAFTCPFLPYDEPPLPLLGTSMSIQAICLPRAELSSTVAPVKSYHPIVRTKLVQQIYDELSDEWFKLLNILGVPLVVVFANLQHNYKDAVVVNKSVNDRVLFTHRGIIYHNVLINVAALEAGSIVGDKHKWWRPASNSNVITERISKNKLRHVVASIQTQNLEVGDKICTIHGQKFTVS
jgi:DNA-directed RNA polymerase beta subunit